MGQIENEQHLHNTDRSTGTRRSAMHAMHPVGTAIVLARTASNTASSLVSRRRHISSSSSTGSLRSLRSFIDGKAAEPSDDAETSIKVRSRCYKEYENCCWLTLRLCSQQIQTYNRELASTTQHTYTPHSHNIRAPTASLSLTLSHTHSCHAPTGVALDGIAAAAVGTCKPRRR